MYFVYYLRSIPYPNRYYVGLTNDIKKRLSEHNDGKSIHTNKFKPWLLNGYTAFTDKQKAQVFETYLKTSSGRAFAKKRF